MSKCSSLTLWNLQLYNNSFEWKNVTFSGGGVKTYSDPLHIFRGSGPPQPPWSTFLIMRRNSLPCSLYSGLARAVLGSTGLFNKTPSSNLAVHLRAVQCDGDERSLSQCRYQENNGICNHSQDAGVFCLGDRLSTTRTTVRSTSPVSTTTLPPRICKCPRSAIQRLAQR